MPNPNTKFTDSYGTDLGNKLITKEYLMSVYPQISNQLITPELWVWGKNASGQIGDNTTINRSTPVTTSAGGANWKQVTCGSDHIAAIKTDGTLWTWGQNANGTLGDNTVVNRSTPVTTFAGGTNWKQVAGGEIHTAAIKTDGTLWTWGWNGYGALGNNAITFRSTPVTTFAGGTTWKQVTCGRRHTAAIKTDGTLWTWGYNLSGQLGDNTATQKITPVTTFAGGTNWKQVSGGNSHTAAIKTDGTLWTWGRNAYEYGILGDNTSATQKITPVTTFAGGTNWKQVAAGDQGNHTAAIKTDGTLWTWGRNSYGQLGDNTTTWRSTPVTTFAGGTNWKQVTCGYNHTAAIKTDGTLWTWGNNYFTAIASATITGSISTYSSVFTTSNTTGAQIGDSVIATSGDLNNFVYMGTIVSISTNTSLTFSYSYFVRGGFSGTITLGSVSRLTPVNTAAGGTNWKQVASGGYHTAAIKTSDNLQGI
jgi:alpha-tubulin suppressor-like RCC1 family protein